ncbi:amidohydrolase family protein [bacterium]|nr:amidohydrolase family protein [bacterium]
MAVIDEMLHAANEEGFFNESAESKVCQDIVLKALAESSFNRNVTIKGGVVMRSITKSARRATQDMDIDFIRYSLNDDSIRLFIDKLHCLSDIRIEQSGEIEELRQEDYFGKRVHIIISDSSGKAIESKIDIGVHSVEESLKGITINGAKSLRRDKTKGSIEIGKDADLVIMDSPSVAYPIYHFAHNHCEKVFVKGKQIL